jgi:hypothetical protein
MLIAVSGIVFYPHLCFFQWTGFVHVVCDAVFLPFGAWGYSTLTDSRNLGEMSGPPPRFQLRSAAFSRSVNRYSLLFLFFSVVRSRHNPASLCVRFAVARAVCAGPSFVNQNSQRLQTIICKTSRRASVMLADEWGGDKR